MLMTPELIEDLKQFGYGKNFQERYFEDLLNHLGNTEELRAQKSVVELNSTDSTGAIPYALSALWTGDEMLKYVSDFHQIQPGDKFIDVGCGFGGAVVAAGKSGLKAMGIELDQSRIEAAKALCLDNNVEAKIHRINIYDPEFAELGKFKLITSLNVVEHVDDVRRFLTTLIDALEPGGCLYIELPNARSIDIVNGEPHYKLPLISLLDYEAAKQLFQSRPDKDIWKMGYEVGEYYSLDFFEQIAHSQNVRFQFTRAKHSYVSFEQARTLFKTLIAHTENIDNEYPNASAHVRERLKINANRYIADIARAISDRYSGGLSARRDIEYFSPGLHLYFLK